VRPQNKKNQPPHKFGTLGRITSSVVTKAANAGWQKTALFSCLIALTFGFLIYWQYLLPMDAVRESLRKENEGLNKQIAIAQMVKQTRPAFIEEYRKAKNIYIDARDLLPNNTELSKVMAAIQDIARRNNVRITLFDASTPNVKSSLGNATVPQQPPAEAAPPQDPNNPTPPPAAPAPRTVLNERLIPAQVIGKHASIMNFLRELATYELIIHTRDIKITALNKEETVNMKLVAFDAPPTSQLPPDPPELRDSGNDAKTARLTPEK
jgi:Tfp pilus assembly protein PilO